jgi:hypothetical protein
MAMKYEYVCSNPTHKWICAPFELSACVGCDPDGKPCKGELKRIGLGSRGGNK